MLKNSNTFFIEEPWWKHVKPNSSQNSDGTAPAFNLPGFILFSVGMLSIATICVLIERYCLNRNVQAHRHARAQQVVVVVPNPEEIPLNELNLPAGYGAV